MICRLISFSAGILCLLAGVSGCSPSERASSEAGTNESQAMLTPDQARQAVLELIRSRPNTFIGAPDADRLEELRLEQRAEGKYAFGAFVVDLPNRRYSADIDRDAPELYSYNGSFVRRDGRWHASEPEVTRLHPPPE